MIIYRKALHYLRKSDKEFSKFLLKTHSVKALGFRKSFFGRSCALEINKWCEALSPDGQRAKIGGCHQYMWKSLQKMTFFKIFQFHMKVLCKTCVCKFKLYQNSLPHKAYVSKCLHKRLENASQSFQPNFRKIVIFRIFQKCRDFH